MYLRLAVHYTVSTVYSTLVLYIYGTLYSILVLYICGTVYITLIRYICGTLYNTLVLYILPRCHYEGIIQWYTTATWNFLALEN